MRGQRLLTTLLVVASVAILAPVAGAKSDLGARMSGAGRTQHEQALRAALASLAAGTVASRLGSPDPQDSASEQAQSGRVAGALGSPDPRDAANEVFHSTKHTGVIGHAGHLGLAPAELAAIQAKQGVEARGGGAGWRDTGIGAGAALLVIAVFASAFLGIRHMRRRVVSPVTSTSYLDRKERPV